MFIKILIIFAIFYFITVFGNPMDKAKIVCPRDSEAIIDNNLSERPCYKIIHHKMTYFEASRACKTSNGFLPGINNSYKDISITSTVLILKQLYKDYYFWLGCQNLTGKFVCDDGTVLGNYNNWAIDNDLKVGRCVVVSLTTGKWKMASCLAKYAFPCQYPSIDSSATTPETNESEPPLISQPWHHRPIHWNKGVNITVDLSNLQFNLPNYSGIFCWIFILLIITFGCLQCLCFQFFRCIEKMESLRRRRGRTFSSNNNNNDFCNSPFQEGRDQRFFSNPSVYSNNGIYSPDPLEEARLLEAQEIEFRQRAFSTFSNRNWIPTINNNNNVQSSFNHSPRSVIITIPPPPPSYSSHRSTIISPQNNTNVEELLILHGNYRNFPSLPRSEVSSILEQLSGNNNYIPRENRPWDRPPQYPLYYTSADEEIGVALSRNIPQQQQQQLLPPPPSYDSTEISSNSIPSSPRIMPPINLHNQTTAMLPPPSNHFFSSENNNFSRIREIGIPVLPPAFENEISNANRIRQGQNRRNYNSPENERLFKKHV